MPTANVMNSRPSFVMAIGAILPASLAAVAQDKPAASIVVKPTAGPLERFAADELQRYIKTLFKVDAEIAETTGSAGYVFRVGVVQEGLSDQGILLRPEGNSLLVGGGSARAALWAVYELIERWGVRFVVHEDVLPAEAGESTSRPSGAVIRLEER